MNTQSVSKAALERKFIECGERDRMKELLLQRLRESGWVEEVENMCRNCIQNKVSQLTFVPNCIYDTEGEYTCRLRL